MIKYVYKVVCDITLENTLKEYMRGTEERAFYEEKEALDFLKKRMSALGCRTCRYKFTDSDGLPVYIVFNSVSCERVDDCDYAHEKDDEDRAEEELLDEALKKNNPYIGSISTEDPHREEESF